MLGVLDWHSPGVHRVDSGPGNFLPWLRRRALKSSEETGDEAILTLYLHRRWFGIVGQILDLHKRFRPNVIVFVCGSPQQRHLTLDVEGKRQWVVLWQL